MSEDATNPNFAFGLNEAVEVTLTGRVVERKQGLSGNSYWIEKTLPDGRTPRQWFKESDVYPVESGAV